MLCCLPTQLYYLGQRKPHTGRPAIRASLAPRGVVSQAAAANSSKKSSGWGLFPTFNAAEEEESYDEDEITAEVTAHIADVQSEADASVHTQDTTAGGEPADASPASSGPSFPIPATLDATAETATSEDPDDACVESYLNTQYPAMPQPHSRIETHALDTSAATAAVAAMAPLASTSQDTFWTTSAGGWVTAFAILFAVKLGRERADSDRYDLRALEVRQQESRVQSRELREARTRYLEQERIRLEALAVARLEEAKRKAAAEEEQRLVQDRQQRMDAARQAEALRQEMEQKRREYLDQEQMMDEEIARRAEIERKLLQENEMKRRIEEEARRLKEEEERRQQEEARRAAEEAARQAAIEAELAQQRRKQQLVELSTWYTMRVESRVTVQQAAPGAITGGPLAKVATLQVQVEMSAGEGQEGLWVVREAFYAGVEDAVEGSRHLSGLVAKDAVQQYLDSEEGRRPLQMMDEKEAAFWGRLASVKICQEAVEAIQRLAGVCAEASGTGSAVDAAGKRQQLQMAAEAQQRHGALPWDHPERADAKLEAVVRQVAAGKLDEGVAVVAEMLEDERKLFLEDGQGGEVARAVHPLLLPACLWAHVVDRAPGNLREAGSSLLTLVRYQLEQRVKDAPRDSLEAPAAVLAALLGEEHPVAAAAAQLADRNLSQTRRELLRARRRQEQFALFSAAARAAEPTPGEASAARVQRRDDMTPTPEKVWAMRNVANNLLRFGAADEAQARQAAGMLQQAVALCQSHYGPTHPAQLAVLLDYSEALSLLPEERVELGAVYQRVLALVQQVVDRYLAQGDKLSALLLLEACVRAFGEEGGLFRSLSPEVEMMARMGASLASQLGPAEMRTVGTKRRVQANVIRQLARSFTEALGAYAAPGTLSMVDLWNRNLPLVPLR